MADFSFNLPPAARPVPKFGASNLGACTVICPVLNERIKHVGFSSLELH